MTMNDLTIREIKARAMVAPLKRPVRTAVGTIPSAPLILIDVLTEQGSAGRSYIFAYTAAALGPLVRLVDEIAAELKGRPNCSCPSNARLRPALSLDRMAGTDRDGSFWA